MNNEAKRLLHQVLRDYGLDLVRDPQRLNALLKDYAQGQYKREIFLCVQAVREGVVQELQNNSHIPLDLLSARMVKQLREDCGLDPGAASWTVDSWLVALGLSDETTAKKTVNSLTASLIKPEQQIVETLLPENLASPQVTMQQIPANEGDLVSKIVKSSSWLKNLIERKSNYLDNLDGTVTDQRTGLQWLRFSLGQSWNGKTSVGEAKEYTFREALDAVLQYNSDNDLNYGHSNWRIPDWNELSYLRESGSQVIDDKAFPNTPNGRFWTTTEEDTSSSNAASSKRFCTVNFNRFNAYYAFGTARGSDLKYVRLVRDPD